MQVYETIKKLIEFWHSKGAYWITTYDQPMGAATFHPWCFQNCFNSNHESFCYIQPSRRNADSRYGESPNRLFSHLQFQVFIKPYPTNIRELYLESLEAIGINLQNHDIKFIENNWASASLGANGVGHEVWLDHMEVTQWTYFQQMGDTPLNITPVELAYGVERLTMFVQNVSSIFNSKWDQNKTYGHLYQQREYEFSKYFLELSQVTEAMFINKYNEALHIIGHRLWIPAYDLLLHMNDIFNSLDAKKLITQNTRLDYIQKMRHITKQLAQIVVNN